MNSERIASEFERRTTASAATTNALAKHGYGDFAVLAGFDGTCMAGALVDHPSLEGGVRKSAASQVGTLEACNPRGGVERASKQSRRSLG